MQGHHRISMKKQGPIGQGLEYVLSAPISVKEKIFYRGHVNGNDSCLNAVEIIQ